MRVYTKIWPKNKFLRWLGIKPKKYFFMELDDQATWSMDHTLAHIVLPMLKQLKETKHGAPFVDYEDVPVYLDVPMTERPLEPGETDSNWFKRWDWVMDEMIWAFEQKLTDWESQYHSGEMDRLSIPVDKDGNEVPEEEAGFYEWRKGP